MISLSKRIESIKITLIFYFSRKSRYSFTDTDVSSNIVELLLLIYYIPMPRSIQFVHDSRLMIMTSCIPIPEFFRMRFLRGNH